MSTLRAHHQRWIVWGLIPGNFYFAVGPFSFNFTWFPLLRNRYQPPGKSLLTAESKAGPSTAKETTAARR